MRHRNGESLQRCRKQESPCTFPDNPDNVFNPDNVYLILYLKPTYPKHIIIVKGVHEIPYIIFLS